MIFEIKKDGRVMMSAITDDPLQIYDEATLREMKAAGYKMTLGGKSYPPKEAKK